MWFFVNADNCNEHDNLNGETEEEEKHTHTVNKIIVHWYKRVISADENRNAINICENSVLVVVCEFLLAEYSHFGRSTRSSARTYICRFLHFTRKMYGGNN